MFYFKDSEYPNSETKTGTTGSFIKYVEKHSCYKVAEKLLLALAEKNKECAVEIFPPKRKKKSSVDFYFEEIELSEEEINAFKLLGKDKNVLLEKTPVIIELHFMYKSDDRKEDALALIIRKYRYIGYNAEKCSYSATPVSTLKKMKQAGYRTGIAIQICDKETSWKSCQERYEKMKETNPLLARAVDKAHHNLVIRQLPETIKSVYESGFADSLEIYERFPKDGTFAVRKIFSSEDGKPLDVKMIEDVLEGRANHNKKTRELDSGFER